MSGESILVVDDSPTELKVFGKALKRAGYNVILESSAERAIAVARQGSLQLIIMDVVMPGLNGFQATRTLKKDDRTRSIPVIIVSSKSQKTDKLWALRQGAEAYLVKPVEGQELLESVARVVNAA